MAVFNGHLTFGFLDCCDFFQPAVFYFIKLDTLKIGVESGWNTNDFPDVLTLDIGGNVGVQAAKHNRPNRLASVTAAYKAAKKGLRTWNKRYLKTSAR